MKRINPINRIVRDFLDGKLTARQRKAFLNLIQRNADSEELENIYQNIFEQIENLSEEEVDLLHELLEKEKKTTGIVYRMKPLFKYAAILLMVCGAYVVYQWTQPSSDNTVLTSAIEQGRAVSRHLLPDSSEIILYGSSRFEVLEYTDKSRTVVLHGEADFSVVPGKTPFFVQTESGYFTKVLGTRFTVRDVRGKYSVAVEKGRVTVGRGEEILGILSRGDSLVVDDEVHLYGAGVSPLVFDNVNLEYVLHTVNQAYDTEVRLAADLDGAVKCTAAFDKNLSIIEIVDILCEMYGYTYSINDHRIIIQH